MQWLSQLLSHFVTNEKTCSGDFGNSNVLCIEKAKEKFCYHGSDKIEHVELWGKMLCTENSTNKLKGTQ